MGLRPGSAISEGEEGEGTEMVGGRSRWEGGEGGIVKC